MENNSFMTVFEQSLFFDKRILRTMTRGYFKLYSIYLLNNN